MNGYTEVLTFILCSRKENFTMLNHEHDISTAVIIANPRSSDFEVCISSPFCLIIVLHSGIYLLPTAFTHLFSFVLVSFTHFIFFV